MVDTRQIGTPLWSAFAGRLGSAAFANPGLVPAKLVVLAHVANAVTI